MPPVGLANISGCNGGRENTPQSTVQEPSTSTTLHCQSPPGPFPSLEARCKEVQTSRAALGSQQLYHFAIRNAEQKRPCLKDDCLREAGSAVLMLFRSQFLPLSGFGETICALLPRRGSQWCSGMICMKDSITGKLPSTPHHVRTMLTRQSCSPQWAGPRYSLYGA